MKHLETSSGRGARVPRPDHPLSTNVPRLTFLLPGYPQWSWGRKARGAVLAVAYAMAAASSLLLWGTPSGGVLMGAAVCLQALSWFEAARRNPFSGMTPSPVLAVTGLGLSAVLHAPLFALLSLIAWPSHGPDPDGGSYLVNRLAYKDRLPSPGQWVWLDGSATGLQSAAKVVAVGGQLVEWTGKRWLVDGKEADLDLARASFGYSRKWTFRVPGDHVLLDPEAHVKPGEARSPLIVVESAQITGRVWAQCAPIWERGLL